LYQVKHYQRAVSHLNTGNKFSKNLLLEISAA